MPEHLIADLALGLIWFAAGFICGADVVMAKARRMVRLVRTVSDANSDYICSRCRFVVPEADRFLLGSDNGIREFAFGLPGDKVLCRNCAFPLCSRRVGHDGPCNGFPNSGCATDSEAQKKAA